MSAFMQRRCFFVCSTSCICEHMGMSINDLPTRASGVNQKLACAFMMFPWRLSSAAQELHHGHTPCRCDRVK